MANLRGNAAAVFKFKEMVVGSKKAVSEPALFDQFNSCEVTEPEMIKSVSLKYCSSLLENRVPSKKYEDDILFKTNIHCIRMNEKIPNDIEELTFEMFENTFEDLKLNKSTKYQFFIKGGNSVKESLFKICSVVWKTEVVPESWAETTLIQLYKGKGCRSNLDNMRHIHIKDEYPKFFGHIVVSAAKDKIIKGMSKFQIATKPGHRVQEHLFVLKSVIGLCYLVGKAVILQFWDLKKFFDSENLRDCMNELYRSGMRGKLYRLIFELNKNTKFKVETPVGTTETRDRGEGLGQGTIEGALISALSLDSSVNEFFKQVKMRQAMRALKLTQVQ